MLLKCWPHSIPVEFEHSTRHSS